MPRIKPSISAVNRKKRLDFARQYIRKYFSFWKSVLFTDESKFNLFGDDGRGKLWRKKNEALKPQYLILTFKHGGGKIMVWGSIAASGVGNLVFIDVTMDHREYRNILRNNLKVSAQRLGFENQWVFQQDNDPKNTAHAGREWILYNVPKQLHSPLQPPDLNPIENIWGEVEQRVSKYRVTRKLRRLL